MTVTVSREPRGGRTTLLAALALGWCACTSVPNPKCLSDNPAPGCPVVDGGADGGVGDGAAAPCGGACSGATPHCNEATNTCVACLETAQCTDATKSVCDTATNTCVACTENAQCGHIAGKGVCDNGACVQCRPSHEAEDCGGKSCNPTTRECTETALGSLSFCNECVSDSECANTAGGVHRCVPMNYNGSARTDGKKFCLIDKSTLPASANGICPVQMNDFVTATSVGGVTTAYCTPRQNLTTCEATLDFLQAGCTTDATCGANLNPTDGMCVNDNGKQCTYRCLGDDDCKTGVKCRTGVSPRYCCTASGVSGCN